MLLAFSLLHALTFKLCFVLLFSLVVEHKKRVRGAVSSAVVSASAEEAPVTSS